MAGNEDDWDENPAIRVDDYAAEWASVVDDAVDDPATGIPVLLDILTRMIADFGAAPEGDAPELGAALHFAAEVRERIDAGEDVPPEDIAAAVDGLVEIYALFETSSEQMADGAGTVEPAAADQLELEDEAGATGETEEDR